MVRPPRLKIADGLYHLMSRGNGRKRIFFGDDDHQRLLRQTRDNLTSYDVELPREQVDLQRIARAVAEALELACRQAGLNQRQIGRHYGKITSMAVCMARRRFREDQAQQYPA